MQGNDVAVVCNALLDTTRHIHTGVIKRDVKPMTLDIACSIISTWNLPGNQAAIRAKKV